MRLKKSVGSIVKALSCHPFASGKNAYCESPLLIVLFSPCPLSMTRTPLMQHLQISPYTQSGDTCTNAVLLSHLAKAYSWLGYSTFKKTLNQTLFIYVWPPSLITNDPILLESKSSWIYNCFFLTSMFSWGNLFVKR